MYKTFKVRTSIFRKPSDAVKVSVKHILLSIDPKIKFTDFRTKYLEIGMHNVKEDYVWSAYFTQFDTIDDFLHISEASKKRNLEKCVWDYVDSYIPLNYAVALFEHLGYADNAFVNLTKSKILPSDRLSVSLKIPYGMRKGTPFHSYRPEKLRFDEEDRWLGRNSPKQWYSSWEDKSHYISYKYKFCKLR